MKATRGPWLGLFARQVITNVVVHVGLSLAAGLLMFIAIDTVETSNMAKNTDDALKVAELELVSLPVVFQQIAAMGMLVGTCTAIASLVRRGEVVAMLGAGGPPAFIWRPALLAALVWCLIFAALTEWVIPDAHAEIRRLRRELRIFTPRSGLEGTNRWFTGQDRIFRVSDLVDADGAVLAGVLILDVRQGKLHQRLDVERLVWSEDGTWTAQDVLHRTWSTPETLTTVRHATLPIPLAETPEDFVRSVGAPERMSFSALRNALKARQRLGHPTVAHRLELYRRITQPLTLLWAMVAAASLMLRVGRRPTLATGLGLGALSGFSLWIVDEVAVALATTSALPTGVSAALPLSLAVGAALMAWIRAYRRGITD